MPNYCLECFNEINGVNLKKKDVKLLMEFCENCETYKECVIKVKDK